MVVQTGGCGGDAAVSVGLQLANSNDFPEAITCNTSTIANPIVLADPPAPPGSNPGTVVDIPTEVVGMPQSPIPDGVIRRSDRFIPPLVLTTNSVTAGTSETAPGIETPITEFSCRVVPKFLRPELTTGPQAAPAVLSSTLVNSGTNLGVEAPSHIAPSNSAPISRSAANNGLVAASSRGRALYRPATPAVQPLSNSTVANLSARDTAVTASIMQPVGFKARRR